MSQQRRNTSKSSLEDLIAKFEDETNVRIAKRDASEAGEALPPPVNNKALPPNTIQASTTRQLRPDTLAKYTEVAQHYLSNGHNAAEAYATVYPKASRATCYTEAWRVLRHPQISQFLDSIHKKVSRRADSAKIAAEAIMRDWYNHAQANVVDYFESDDNGQLMITDVTKLPVEVQRRLRSVDLTVKEIVTDSGDTIRTTVIKLKTVDPQKALDSLAKSIGLLNDTSDVNVIVNTADAMERAVQRRKTMGGRRPVTVDHDSNVD